MVTAAQDRESRQIVDVLGQVWPWGPPDVEAFEIVAGRRTADAIVRLCIPDGAGPRMLIEVKPRLTPAAVAPLALQLREMIVETGVSGAVVVSAWLSRQTQRQLERAGIGYADATGNLLVELDRPAVYVRDRGADRNPDPAPQRRMGLSGVRAGEIVRTLLEVEPPYGVDDLTGAIDGVSAGTVSKVLAGLADDGLIDRQPYGPVTDVDIRGLMEAWVGAYDLFKRNSVRRYVDLYGPRNTADRLLRLGDDANRWVATGSLVAAALAPVAGPALAMIYADRPKRLADRAGLIPADDTANVFLMAPYSPIVFTRTWVDGRSGLPCVSPAQAVADLQVDRGPQEAQALLDWMVDNPAAWRVPGLSSPSNLVERVT